MAIKIKFDLVGNPEPPTIILANRNGNKLGQLKVNEDSIDLIDKFFSESMENKYKNNVKKDTMAYMDYREEVCHCDECGKEISKYDSNITEATFGIPLCQKCSEKMLNYM